MYGINLLTLLATSHWDLRSAFGGAIPSVAPLALQPSLVQQHALASLVALATNHHDNKRAMVDTGAIPGAVAMLQQSGSVDVCSHAAALLLQLACDSAVFKERMVDAGAVPVLLSRLGAHSATSLGVHVAAVLRSLALSEHARRAMVAANGMQQLAVGLQRGSNDCQAIVAEVVGVLVDKPPGVNAADVVVEPLVALLQSPSGACRRAAAVTLRAVAVRGRPLGAGAEAVVAQQLRAVGPRDVEERDGLQRLAAALRF